jgi:hypothetical protein
VWLSVIALSLALLSVLGSVWNYIDSLDRPKKHELKDLLEQQSGSVLKQYATQFRALETEWEDMYQKFTRLAGRMDRNKALVAGDPQPPAPEPGPLSRRDIMRNWRRNT